jgi:HEPN domain-containing protein
MSGPDEGATDAERRREAARWLAVAAEDARVARVCLEMPQPALGIAAYHCQQAAEKLVKGLLVVAGAGFPRTHDLAELAGRAMPFYRDLSPLLEAIGPLTVWSVAYRYPGIEEDDEPDPGEAALLNALATIGDLTERLQSLALG